MRAKDVRRQPAPPPRRSRSGRDLVAFGVLGLAVVVVAIVAFISLANPGSTPGASTRPSQAALASGSPSGVPLPSGSDVPTASVAAAALEALMPKSVNGTALTTQSARGPFSALISSPGARALDAAVAALGKKPSDLEIAESADSGGALDLSVLGFRVAGIDPAQLLPAVLDGWLSSKSPGVKTATVTLVGTPTTEVSYGSGSKDYVFVHGDAVLVIETADPAVPAEAVAAITGAPAPTAAPSGLPSAPASSLPSPAASK